MTQYVPPKTAASSPSEWHLPRSWTQWWEVSCQPPVKKSAKHSHCQNERNAYWMIFWRRAHRLSLKKLMRSWMNELRQNLKSSWTTWDKWQSIRWSQIRAAARRLWSLLNLMLQVRDQSPNLARCKLKFMQLYCKISTHNLRKMLTTPTLTTNIVSAPNLPGVIYQLKTGMAAKRSSKTLCLRLLKSKVKRSKW